MRRSTRPHSDALRDGPAQLRAAVCPRARTRLQKNRARTNERAGKRAARRRASTDTEVVLAPPPPPPLPFLFCPQARAYLKLALASVSTLRCAACASLPRACVACTCILSATLAAATTRNSRLARLRKNALGMGPCSSRHGASIAASDGRPGLRVAAEAAAEEEEEEEEEVDRGSRGESGGLTRRPEGSHEDTTADGAAARGESTDYALSFSSLASSVRGERGGRTKRRRSTTDSRSRSPPKCELPLPLLLRVQECVGSSRADKGRNSAVA